MTTSSLLLALALSSSSAQAQADSDWAVIAEDDRANKVETDKLEDMHQLSDRYKGHTPLQADKMG